MTVDWHEHLIADPAAAALIIRADPFSMAVRRLRGASNLGNDGVLYLSHIVKAVNVRRIWPYETRVWDQPVVRSRLF